MSSRSMKVATLTANRVHHFVAIRYLRFGAKLVRRPCKASRQFAYLIRSPDQMASDFEHTSHVPMIRLLDAAFDEFTADLAKRVAATAYSDIRVTHGCVFGTIDPEGTRLTDLAERAHMTKQSGGEVASDLEQRGCVERVPDPSDGRAKIT